MLIIGLLLVLAALAAGGAVAYDGSETTRVEFFNHSGTMTVAEIFFAGVAAMAVLAVGLWAMSASMRRARARRVARREARLEHRDSVRSLEDEKAQLAEENARLERQLQNQRAGTAVAGGAAAGGTAAATRGYGSDRDGDGVPDRQERGGLFGRNRDRDGDGIPDAQETQVGSHRADGTV